MTERDETAHSWIADLDDSIVKRLRMALAGKPDREIYGALDDELWRRDSKPIDTWPTSKSKVADLTFVEFCFDATSPDDAKHRPVRMLDDWLECSCGRREDEDMMNGRQWRVPGPHWWPVEIIDGVPHLIICPGATFADDIDHAPSQILDDAVLDSITFCICGRQYVRIEEDGLYRGAKMVPAI